MDHLVRQTMFMIVAVSCMACGVVEESQSNGLLLFNDQPSGLEITESTASTILSIESVEPASGILGDEVIIRGMGVAASEDVQVFFNLLAAEVVGGDDDHIVVVVPDPGPEGFTNPAQLAFRVGANSVSLASAFEYLDPGSILDSDGDGVVDNDDCAPNDADRYPGAPDQFDGKDTNCRWDYVRCQSSDSPGADVVGHCTDFEVNILLNFMNGAGSSSYCLRPEIIPGPGVDPFVDATLELSIRRARTPMHTSVANTVGTFAYELSDTPETDCGPKAMGSDTFSETELRTFATGESNDVCAFGSTEFGLTTFTSINVSGEENLWHQIITRQQLVGTFVSLERQCNLGD